MTMTAEQTALIADATALLKARIDTCDMYIRQTSDASIRRVVVSNLTNARLVFQNGEGRQALTVRLMPTSWMLKDAKAIAASFNAQFEAEGNNERLSLITEFQWWKNEREQALSALSAFAA